LQPSFQQADRSVISVADEASERLPLVGDR
jgi:hypothetical protein